MLKLILIAIILLVIVALILAALKPNRFRVERSASIKAPPQKASNPNNPIDILTKR